MEDKWRARMVGASSLQPRLLSSFVGDRFVQSQRPLHQLFRCNPGHFSSFSWIFFSHYAYNHLLHQSSEDSENRRSISKNPCDLSAILFPVFTFRSSDNFFP